MACPNVHIISPQVIAHCFFTQMSIYSQLPSFMNEFQQYIYIRIYKYFKSMNAPYDDICWQPYMREDPKAPFSIATTPRSRGGCYSIARTVPLYPWSSLYSAECLARQHQVPFFESLVWLDLRLNLSLLDHWQTLYSLGQWPSLMIYKI